MNTRKFLLVTAGLLVIFLAAVLANLDSGEEAFAAQVQAERAQLLKAWQNPGNDKSPIPQSERAGLVIPHYPPALQWRAEAELKTDAALPQLPDVAGWVHFQLQGKALQLLAFRERATGPDALFIPFYDATTGRTTYGGGRYLNARVRKDGCLTLDFNNAYNPYCVYDPARYGSCPLPPAQNRLPLAIEAGQQLWKPRQAAY
ncbi:MAG: DUF1684 domain-containing protein [Bacteroidetes bacterium]|nr:DUF1684 domain-containing protein [Bacteroidota bacterium]